MRKLTLTFSLMLAALVLVTPAVAQEAHVVGEAELHGAVVGRAQTDEAKRETIRSLLRRPEVRDAVAGAGLDVTRAEAAVGGVTGAELDRLAARASEANAQLAGGADNIVIGTTTLIIILLIVIILILL